MDLKANATLMHLQLASQIFSVKCGICAEMAPTYLHIIIVGILFGKTQTHTYLLKKYVQYIRSIYGVRVHTIIILLTSTEYIYKLHIDEHNICMYSYEYLFVRVHTLTHLAWEITVMMAYRYVS